MISNSDVLIGRRFPGCLKVIGNILASKEVDFRYVEGRLFYRFLDSDDVKWRLVEWYHRPFDNDGRIIYRRRY